MSIVKLWTLTFLLVLSTVGNCLAAPLKVYVSLFAVTGAANKDELRPALQTLLISRLGGETISIVENEAQADFVISGSYLGFGKVFSLDASVRGRDGAVQVRAFEQGDSAEDMLMVVGKLAKTLSTGIDKIYRKSAQLTNSPAHLITKPLALVDQKTALSSNIIRAEATMNRLGGVWISQKLGGEMTGIALGRKLGDNNREIFITGSRSFQYYLLGSEMILQAEVILPLGLKILGVDTADLDNNGISEIFLTLMDGDKLSSQIWIPEGKSLKKLSDELPYLFRAIAFQGKSRKIYAQQLGGEADYYGDLYEVTGKGALIELKNPVKLPHGANILNVNMFRRDDKSFSIVINTDGYLLVYNEKGEKIWKSSEKYGGSEAFISIEDMQGMKTTGSPVRKVFLEQRILVTRDGEVIVPKNEGSYNIGNSRSYTKNSLNAFSWNGVTLEEIWHTRLSQNYLVDYQLDEERKELITLEVVLKSGIFEKGASAVSIKKIE